MVRAVWHAGRTPRSLDPRVPARRSAGDSARLGCQPPSPPLPSPHRTASHRTASPARAVRRVSPTRRFWSLHRGRPLSAPCHPRSEKSTTHGSSRWWAALRHALGWGGAGLFITPAFAVVHLRAFECSVPSWCGIRAHLCGARLTDGGTALTRLVNPWRRAARANESSGGAAEDSGKERLTSERDLPLSPVCSRPPLSRSPARRR